MTALSPVSLVSHRTAPGNTRFGRAPKEEELEALKKACKEANLNPDRVESLTTRVIENPDQTMAKWLYRVTQMPFDWIRNIWGYLKHLGDKEKPYDIHWAKLEGPDEAKGWGAQWERMADERNLEFKKDKVPLRFTIIKEKPESTSVLRILEHFDTLPETAKKM